MEAVKAPPPAPSAGAIVRLNIGGVHLCTTAATLLSHGDNFFSGLLSGRFSALTDETGAYFIDRSGRAFEPLLDYLRNGTLIIPPHVSLDAVLVEAQYFLIDISRALSGMLRSGLYSGRNVGGADVAILFVEKDPAFPAQVAVTGVIEGYLCFEHVCPIEQGKVVLRIPSSEFLLQPAGAQNLLVGELSKRETVWSHIHHHTMHPPKAFAHAHATLTVTRTHTHTDARTHHTHTHTHTYTTRHSPLHVQTTHTPTPTHHTHPHAHTHTHTLPHPPTHSHTHTPTPSPSPTHTRSPFPQRAAHRCGVGAPPSSARSACWTFCVSPAPRFHCRYASRNWLPVSVGVCAA